MNNRKLAWVVSFDAGKPSLIFANDISIVANNNKSAQKIELLDCWIVPGQLKEDD